MQRRHFLSSLTAAATLSSCATKGRVSTPLAPLPQLPTLAPIRAQVDRMFRITVCSRPFRAAGPRLDVERIGDKTVVHNYGHGGSGWSLSWGSGRIVVDKALATGEKDIAVIGCGALGLTAAVVAQRTGARVTIYAKERPPEVRSARATGSWTPDSRIALEKSVDANFPALWERMTRDSFRAYESYLGMAGNPVEWLDRYTLYDEPLERSQAQRRESDTLGFAHYMDRIADITPRSIELPAGSHPFPTKFARRGTSLTFNVAGYSHQLLNEFFTEGGKFERREFNSPADFAALPQKTIIHSTGYGARTLFKDESIVPVRGQIAWLIPQPEVNYAVMYKGLNILSRRDGIVVQSIGSGEMEGYNDPSETPDRADAEANIRTVAELYERMAAVRKT